MPSHCNPIAGSATAHSQQLQITTIIASRNIFLDFFITRGDTVFTVTNWGNDMQEDDFLKELDFSTLRDCSGGPEVNQYQVYLDEAAIKGQKVFVSNDGDRLTLYTKEQFELSVSTIFLEDTYDVATGFNCVTDFVLVGDEYIEGINDPDELEDALNSWGVY